MTMGKARVAAPEILDGLTPLGRWRKGFWTFYLDRFPAEGMGGTISAVSSRWSPVGHRGLQVVQYLAQSGVGVFVRGERGMTLAETRTSLTNNGEALVSAFGGSGSLEEPGPNDDGYFVRKAEGDATDTANWPWMAEWLHRYRNEWVARAQSAFVRSNVKPVRTDLTLDQKVPA